MNARYAQSTARMRSRMRQTRATGFSTARATAEAASSSATCTLRIMRGTSTLSAISRGWATTLFAERGLPRELAGALPCGDAAALEGALDALEAAFRSAVQAEVDKRLRGRMPSGAGVGRPDPDSLTDAEYYRLSAGRTAAQDAGAR